MNVCPGGCHGGRTAWQNGRGWPQRRRLRHNRTGGERAVNEWVAFGIVAVICGVLAVLVRLAGSDGSEPPAADGD